MSMRQPEARSQKPEARRKTQSRRSVSGEAFSRCCLLASGFWLLLFSVFHICHLPRPEGAQKFGRPLAVVEGIARLDEEEEAVARGEREVRHVEDRMIWFGQPVEGQHAEDAGERGAQHGRLERDRDE